MVYSILGSKQLPLKIAILRKLIFEFHINRKVYYRFIGRSQRREGRKEEYRYRTGLLCKRKGPRR